MDNGFFWIDFIAKARANGKDVVCRAKIGSDKGDPGYKETAKVCGVPHSCVYDSRTISTELDFER